MNTRPLALAIGLLACAPHALAQSVRVTQEWTFDYDATTAPPPSHDSFALDSVYHVGANENRSASGFQGGTRGGIVIDEDYVFIDAFSGTNLLAHPGISANGSTTGEVVVTFPAGHGTLDFELFSHTTGGPGIGAGSMTVDIHNDGSIDTQTPVFNLINTSIDVASDSPFDVRINITGLMASNSIDEFATHVEMTWNRQPTAVLPQNHHLIDFPGNPGAQGTDKIFRDGYSQFQIFYEGQHFLDAGVTGPITIERLRFRGLDGHIDRGGYQWNNVVIGLATTAATSLTNDFALNTFVANMGPAAMTTVVQESSVGSTPNNPNITIDLAAIGASIEFDPTGAYPNLLIEVLAQNGPVPPPQGGPLLPMQDTADDLPGVHVRGAALWTPTASLTGTLTNPPVMTVDFSGSGDHIQPRPATNEAIGAACGDDCASFYQAFLPGQFFDLYGLTMTLQDGGVYDYYDVDSGANALFTHSIPPVSTADNEDVAHTLPFTFHYPGGSTNQIWVSTNGHIQLDNDQSIFPTTGTPTIGKLLGQSAFGPSLAPCWFDWDCGKNSNSGLYIQNRGFPPNREVIITWQNAGVFHADDAGEASCTFQCVLHEDHTVEYRYGSMPDWIPRREFTETPAIVGFSPGLNGFSFAVDPQTRNLSHEVPFSTSFEGTRGNVELRVTTPTGDGGYYGERLSHEPIRWEVDNVPSGFPFGLLLIDVLWVMPGFSFPGIHAPDCRQNTTTNQAIHEVLVFTGSSGVTGNFSLPAALLPDLLGVGLASQFASLDLSGGTGPLVPAMSNTILQRVGLR